MPLSHGLLTSVVLRGAPCLLARTSAVVFPTRFGATAPQRLTFSRSPAEEGVIERESIVANSRRQNRSGRAVELERDVRALLALSKVQFGTNDYLIDSENFVSYTKHSLAWASLLLGFSQFCLGYFRWKINTCLINQLDINGSATIGFSV